MSATPRMKPAADVVARRLEDEVVLVNLRTNRIFSLNSTGARFWELLDAGHERDEIEQLLVTEFELAPDQAHVEVDELLDSLRSEGLVDAADG